MNKEIKSINTIRMLSVDAIQKANSGHPGLPLGAAPMAYTLWSRFLKHNPKNSNWHNRDRFVLSAGHGSALLYSMLHLFGYNVSLEDLKNFRQLSSLTPGHPEYGHTDGVETSTGPLGQGIATAVGMAMAEKHLAAKFNRDIELVNHYTYALCGDGDLMEGISNEASSLAGTLKLGKLIVLYDSNKITIEGSTDVAFKEDVLMRYEALGWSTIHVADGNDVEEISMAIEKARTLSTPTIIKVDTVIGYGSPKAGSSSSHGEPLGADNIKKTREYFQCEDEDFYISDEVKSYMEKVVEKLVSKYDEEQKLEEEYKEKYPEEYKFYMENYNVKTAPEVDFLSEEGFTEFEKDMATRASSGIILNRLSKKVDNLFGGSADLGPSNKTELKDLGFFSDENPKGRNINFGVRENAMAAISNGILLHGGLRSFCATFLVFSDYLKPSIRLSALMNLPVIYVFTHDSIGVGEDGPTHQPIEHLAMLRSIPNLIVYRPADSMEVAVGYNVAMNLKNTPIAMILSRQDLPRLENSSRDACKGGYIVKNETEKLDGILIATGSEVSIAIEAAEKLEAKGLGIRVVSMPSQELFEAQERAYKEKILPRNCTKRIAIEAGSYFGWHKYVGLDGKVMSIDEFGVSGKGSEVFNYFGITPEKIVENFINL